MDSIRDQFDLKTLRMQRSITEQRIADIHSLARKVSDDRGAEAMSWLIAYSLQDLRIAVVGKLNAELLTFEPDEFNSDLVWFGKQIKAKSFTKASQKLFQQEPARAVALLFAIYVCETDNFRSFVEHLEDAANLVERATV